MLEYMIAWNSKTVTEFGQHETDAFRNPASRELAVDVIRSTLAPCERRQKMALTSSG